MNWEGRDDDSDDDSSALELNAPDDDEIFLTEEDNVRDELDDEEGNGGQLYIDENYVPTVNNDFTFSSGLETSGYLPDYLDDEFDLDLQQNLNGYTNFGLGGISGASAAASQSYMNLIDPQMSFANGFRPNTGISEVEADFSDEEADEVEEYAEEELLVVGGVDGDDYFDDYCAALEGNNYHQPFVNPLVRSFENPQAFPSCDLKMPIMTSVTGNSFQTIGSPPSVNQKTPEASSSTAKVNPFLTPTFGNSRSFNNSESYVENMKMIVNKEKMPEPPVVPTGKVNPFLVPRGKPVVSTNEVVNPFLTSAKVNPFLTDTRVNPNPVLTKVNPFLTSRQTDPQQPSIVADKKPSSEMHLEVYRKKRAISQVVPPQRSATENSEKEIDMEISAEFNPKKRVKFNPFTNPFWSNIKEVHASTPGDTLDNNKTNTNGQIQKNGIVFDLETENFEGGCDGLGTTYASNNMENMVPVNGPMSVMEAQAILGGQTVPFQNTNNRKKSRTGRPPPEVDPELQKYWRQRHELFSRYDEGIKLDRESWFSVTPEKIAVHIAERCKTGGTIIDAFCGCGGNTIQFAKTCGKVIAIDIDPVKIQNAKHNAKIYGVENKIEFVTADFMAIASVLKADVVFLSPPWGGPNYLKSAVFDVKTMIPMDGYKVFHLARAISPNVAYFVPRNVNQHQLDELAGGEGVEIESNMFGSCVKTVTAYYGDLCRMEENEYEAD